MRMLFVMDPTSTILVDEDTSFALMYEAQSRGHRVDHCLLRDLYARGGEPRARIRQATMSRETSDPVVLGNEEDLAISGYDAVFIRKDPPFDEDYHWASLVLDLAREHALIINDPRGLAVANEKLYALHFPDLTPETLVSADASQIRAFVNEVGGRGVIKPIDGHGGAGIFVLETGDLNFNAHVETVTQNGRRMAMVQRYLPEVREGDKRILLLDGEVLGAINRIPPKDDARSNIHVGGRVEAVELNDDDRRIVERMAPQLREDKLYFVGIDVIGGRLTEVNVTSPTGIQQMTRLQGENVESKVIRWVEDQGDR